MILSKRRIGEKIEIQDLYPMALDLLEQEPAVKVKIKAKRLKCGWDTKYLFRELAG